MTESTGTRTDAYTCTRTFDAPREDVFRAWTDPASFGRWWGGREASTRDSVSMDVRVGGEWRGTIHHPGGVQPFSGVFREIVAPERLVMTLSDKADPDPVRFHLVTVDLRDVRGRTEMHFTQLGDFGDDPEAMKKNLESGYPNFFDALAELVETR
jgi:uncharacterized protein YndB with AHSA1/START domain